MSMKILKGFTEYELMCQLSDWKRYNQKVEIKDIKFSTAFNNSRKAMQYTVLIIFDDKTV